MNGFGSGQWANGTPPGTYFPGAQPADLVRASAGPSSSGEAHYQGIPTYDAPPLQENLRGSAQPSELADAMARMIQSHRSDVLMNMNPFSVSQRGSLASQSSSDWQPGEGTPASIHTRNQPPPPTTDVRNQPPPSLSAAGYGGVLAGASTPFGSVGPMQASYGTSASMPGPYGNPPSALSAGSGGFGSTSGGSTSAATSGFGGGGAGPGGGGFGSAPGTGGGFGSAPVTGDAPPLLLPRSISGMFGSAPPSSRQNAGVPFQDAKSADSTHHPGRDWPPGFRPGDPYSAGPSGWNDQVPLADDTKGRQWQKPSTWEILKSDWQGTVKHGALGLLAAVAFHNIMKVSSKKDVYFTLPHPAENFGTDPDAQALFNRASEFRSPVNEHCYKAALKYTDAILRKLGTMRANPGGKGVEGDMTWIQTWIIQATAAWNEFDQSIMDMRMKSKFQDLWPSITTLYKNYGAAAHGRTQHLYSALPSPM